MKTKTVLFVDDEKNVLAALERYLLREPYRKLFALGAAEALEILAREPATVIVSDIRMPNMTGLELLAKVREVYPNTVRMVLSGTSESELVLKAINSGEVYRYLTKPLNDMSELRVTLRQAIEYHDLQAMKRELVAELAKKNSELATWQERMAKDLQIAGRFQQSLMSTQTIKTGNYEVRAAYHPCMTIGGDFFDLVEFPDGRLCVYIADVAGHGIASALISTLLKLSATDIVKKYADYGPALVCKRISQYMHEHALCSDSFTTLFLAIYEPKTSTWNACRCGHPLPVLCGADGTIKTEEISENGTFPLGFFDDPALFTPAIEVSWKGNHGDTVCFFTDGLTEARQIGSEELFTQESLAELVSKMITRSPQMPDPGEILASIKEAGFNTDYDDCCAILIRTV